MVLLNSWISPGPVGLFRYLTPMNPTPGKNGGAKMPGSNVQVLGWPKSRVLAEALLRLHAALHRSDREDFAPFTPDPRTLEQRLKLARQFLATLEAA